MRRGEIYFAALDPTVGAEVQKTRPVVVVSNNAANRASSVVTVVPLTSNVARVFPFEVLLPAARTGLTKDSKAMAQQVRTPAPPAMRSSIRIVDVDSPGTWTRYRAGLCDSCQANCCTMPLEVRLPTWCAWGWWTPSRPSTRTRGPHCQTAAKGAR
jgi:mRNA interferase MazF